MFALQEKIEPIFNDSLVIQSILDHPAWYGEIEGLKAEKLVRGKASFTYFCARANPLWTKR